ncbi:hypothetical protein Taro_031479 [Colocasia esculenta]|uniref:UBC core domain-containing protein n=1 Tax=Colocasia esculenta TaxID=4460 RepID=A0A843W114_COLES|nr:hypothetical protein [Colocasia esculenta]
MAEEKYNLKNPAVKRILQEVKEMQANPSDDFMSLPLEENIFEWQFAIRGPRDSEFQGGIYHGRIQLPSEYPFKPPSFMLLTPNGRFETQTKICLSISNHHPEHWQPSWSASASDLLELARSQLLKVVNDPDRDDCQWSSPVIKCTYTKTLTTSFSFSVRTALVALIAFMPTNPDGALGSLEYTKEERRALAIRSREAAPRYGTQERQRLIDEIHEYMLSKAPPVPELAPSAASDKDPNEAGEENAQPNHLATDAAAATPDSPNQGSDTNGNPEAEERLVEEVREVRLNAGAGGVRVSFSAGVRFQRTTPNVDDSGQPANSAARVRKPVDDRLFTYAAVGLTVAIIVLLVKKFLKSNGLAGYTDSF